MSDKKKDLEEPEDHTWVLDSLVQFLSGQVWNKPITAFIEKKSTIFEADTEDFTPEHHLIHREYRNLVDSLLGGFVEELHISPNQFQQAVSNGEGSSSSGAASLARFQPGALLEQVWAASDFTTFSQLMGLRNLELQLQALDSLRHRGSNLALEAFLDDEGGELGGGEDRLLKHVLRRSMEEASIVERMKKMNRHSLAEPGGVRDKETFDFDQLKKTIEQTPTTLAEPANKSAPGTEAVKKTEIEVRKSPRDKSPAVDVRVPALTDEEIKKRKDYLCQQRDKLLKAKGKTKQPETSPVEVQNIKQEPEQETEDAIQLRRALVDRLKAEIIKKM